MVKIFIDDPVSIVKLPFIHVTIDKIAHKLKKHKALATFNPISTIKSSLKFVNDLVNPKDMKGVYSIPCSCGILYIGEAGRSTHLHIYEHAPDIRHKRSHSSTIFEHVEKTMHHVCIEDSQVIARIDHFHHRKLREAIEIEKHVRNLNGDYGWKLSRSCV